MGWNETFSLLEKKIRASFAHTNQVSVAELPGASEGLAVCAIHTVFRRNTLWVLGGPGTMETSYLDLRAISSQCREPVSVLSYPPREDPLTEDPEAVDPDIAGSRLQVLRHFLQKKGSAIIVTCIQALMQPAASPHSITARVVSLTSGTEVDYDHLRELLHDLGYRVMPQVSSKGEVSVRGAIVDVWPLTDVLPTRMEFEGPCLQSIRLFDPVDQRSVRQIESAAIMPASDDSMSDTSGKHHALPDFISGPAVVVWSHPASIEQDGAAYEDVSGEAAPARTIIPFKTVHQRVSKACELCFTTGDLQGDAATPQPFAFRPIRAPSSVARDAVEPDIMTQARLQFLTGLRALAEAGRSVCLFFDTGGALERFKAAHSAAETELLSFHIGALSAGFVDDELNLTVVAESDLYGKKRFTRARRLLSAEAPPAYGLHAPDPLLSPSDLEPGDLVVHIQYGIGKYLGFNEIRFDEEMQQVLTIEYADGAKLHVPVSHSHLLSRYIGISEKAVPLHRLGSNRWSSDKRSAENAVQDLAASLLQTHAERNTIEGYGFSRDAPWQHGFETSFPYTETPDQHVAWRHVKKDMELARPMDRLVCGDVGFGKTEIAMRAAFKAVMDGTQVAVLVPTTVLCQQHFDTFRERMTAYPIRIEMLSRFCPLARRESIMSGMANGAVDIVIGTHALLRPNMKFKNLQLVIIDEEQRFGVGHKERLKHIRRLVDVLTLSATPIPRTLYMSLVGVKDLSTLQTPPQHRLSIDTVIAESSDRVIRDAILREMSREGQVYYLYNRILTIDRIRKRLEQLVPEATIAVAHGRMSARELARIMHDFVAGHYHVLLCTTIIESGLDIPNVNTIIIDRADRFGLADLYQLRGRVGRSVRKAYAYLLISPQSRLDPASRRRVQLIRRYTELGSGFQLALRDLELRGAGNLLGTQQSGHIAAVGFALYCQLLRRAVEQLRGDTTAPLINVVLRFDFISLSAADEGTDHSALIPSRYIPVEHQRVDVYRRIAGAGALIEIDRIYNELRDRFGNPPDETNMLLLLARIRIRAAAHSISMVETRNDKLMLLRGGGYLKVGRSYPLLNSTVPKKKLEEIDALLDSL